MEKKIEWLTHSFDIDSVDSEVSFENAVDNIINKLNSDTHLIRKVVKFIIFYKILKVFINNSFISAIYRPKIEEKLTSFIPKENWLNMFNAIKTDTGLRCPKLLWPKWKFILIILLLLIPIIGILILLYFRVEFILLLWGMLNVGSILIVVFSLYILVYLFVPGFFRPTELPSLDTVSDLVNTLMIFNLHSFIEDGYSKIRQELNDDDLWGMAHQSNDLG